MRTFTIGLMFACYFLTSEVMAQYVVRSPNNEGPNAKQQSAGNQAPGDGQVQDQNPGAYEWRDKLKRGALNIVTSPVEIPKQVHERAVHDSLAVGWTIGIVEGFGKGFIRFGAGVIDLITCPFNFPKAGKAPLIEPEYAWLSSA